MIFVVGCTLWYSITVNLASREFPMKRTRSAPRRTGSPAQPKQPAQRKALGSWGS